MWMFLGLLLLVSIVFGRPPNGPNPLPEERGKLVKILHGVDARDGQFPYVASLGVKGYGSHLCGCSILTSEWVLTAGHCCTSSYVNDFEVYAGSIYLNNGGQIRRSKKYIVHPDYDPFNNWKNDLCVVQLESPLELNNRTARVLLPEPDFKVPGGENTTTPGWGFTAEGNIPNCLQVLYNETTLNNSECSSSTGQEIGVGQICVSAGPGYGVCNGDSGDPLTLDGMQIGITSWGFQPCGSGKPDVFVRVTQYVDWIKSVIGESAKDLLIAEKSS